MRAWEKSGSPERRWIAAVLSLAVVEPFLSDIYPVDFVEYVIR